MSCADALETHASTQCEPDADWVRVTRRRRRWRSWSEIKATHRAVETAAKLVEFTSCTKLSPRGAGVTAHASHVASLHRAADARQQKRNVQTTKLVRVETGFRGLIN